MPKLSVTFVYARNELLFWACDAITSAAMRSAGGSVLAKTRAVCSVRFTAIRNAMAAIRSGRVGRRRSNTLTTIAIAGQLMPRYRGIQIECHCSRLRIAFRLALQMWKYMPQQRAKRQARAAMAPSELKVRCFHVFPD